MQGDKCVWQDQASGSWRFREPAVSCSFMQHFKSPPGPPISERPPSCEDCGEPGRALGARGFPQPHGSGQSAFLPNRHDLQLSFKGRREPRGGDRTQSRGETPTAASWTDTTGWLGRKGLSGESWVPRGMRGREGPAPCRHPSNSSARGGPGGAAEPFAQDRSDRA